MPPPVSVFASGPRPAAAAADEAVEMTKAICGLGWQRAAAWGLAVGLPPVLQIKKQRTGRYASPA